MTFEIVLAALAKYKAYLIALLMGFVASTIRIIEFKRKVREGKTKAIKMLGFTDWFLFGCMAAVVAATGVSVIDYLGMEFTEPMIVLIFWLGYITDYLFQWIPAILKDKLKKYANKDKEIM